MDLFQYGDFTLNSGKRSRWKIECDALKPGEVQALAQLIHEMVGPVRSVVGVPRGGVALAQTLLQYAVHSDVHPILIVDDVLTTGGSMERMRTTLINAAGAKENDFIGAVVFARGKCPDWIQPVFQMSPRLWI